MAMVVLAPNAEAFRSPAGCRQRIPSMNISADANHVQRMRSVNLARGDIVRQHSSPVKRNSPGGSCRVPQLQCSVASRPMPSSLKSPMGSRNHSKSSTGSAQSSSPVTQRTLMGVEAAVASAKSQGKTGLIIWFHYLGGKGADWEHCLKAKIANQLPWVEWFLPDAPSRPVTNYDGAVVPAWFDQLEGEVTEQMGTPGLDESVSLVHTLLHRAETLGIPGSRIVLGGMSQGGVLAMAAGLSYDTPLAGIAAVSAWVPSALLASIRQPSTPLFLGNGDRDEVVPVGVATKGRRKLERAGIRLTSKQYPGLAHTFADYEKEDIKKFAIFSLPKVAQLDMLSQDVVTASSLSPSPRRSSGSPLFCCIQDTTHSRRGELDFSGHLSPSLAFKRRQSI